VGTPDGRSSTPSDGDGHGGGALNPNGLGGAIARKPDALVSDRLVCRGPPIALACSPVLSGYPLISARRQERELEQLFEANNRQQQLERLNERRELYLSFRNAAAAMVEELADGGEPRRRYFNVMR
jgi:hypothetical protein